MSFASNRPLVIVKGTNTRIATELEAMKNQSDKPELRYFKINAVETKGNKSNERVLLLQTDLKLETEMEKLHFADRIIEKYYPTVMGDDNYYNMIAMDVERITLAEANELAEHHPNSCHIDPVSQEARDYDDHGFKRDMEGLLGGSLGM